MSSGAEQHELPISQPTAVLHSRKMLIMWRNTGQPVRVVMLDARALLPLLCFVVYWSWFTFYVAVIGITFFSLISFMGMTLPTMFRLIRRLLVGPVRPAVPAWNRRRLA